VIVNIDVDALTARRQELRKELTRIDALLSLTEERTKELPVAKVVEEPAPRVNGSSPRKEVHTGQRKAVTLALNTGPAREDELALVLGWSKSTVAAVVNSMLHQKIVFLNEHDKLALSTQGKEQAAWFQTHPSYTVYCPGRAKH
jgi:hypothetical protein